MYCQSHNLALKLHVKRWVINFIWSIVLIILTCELLFCMLCTSWGVTITETSWFSCDNNPTTNSKSYQGLTNNFLFLFPKKIHLSILLEKCTYIKQKETFHLTSIVIQKLIPTYDQTDDIICGTNGAQSTSYAIKKEAWHNSSSYQQSYMKISEALAIVS